MLLKPAAKKITSFYYLLRYVFRVYLRNSSWKQKKGFLVFVAGRLFNNARRPAAASVILALTYRCQNKCVHCAMAGYKKNDEEFDLPQIKEVLMKLKKNGFQDVSLFGGEPLLRDDLTQIVQFAAHLSMTLHLDTNGIGLKEKARSLKNAGLNHVFISLDSASKKEHNALRGNAYCYDEVIMAVKECKKLLLPFTLSTYVTREDMTNRSRIANIVVLAKRNNAVGVRLVASVLSGKWLNREDLRLNDIERRNFNNILDGFVYFETPANLSVKRICLSLRKKLIFVSPYGDVQPCAYVPLSFGNIKQEKIGEILRRMWKCEIFYYRYGMDECIANHPSFIEKFSGNKMPHQAVDRRDLSHNRPAADCGAGN